MTEARRVPAAEIGEVAGGACEARGDSPADAKAPCNTRCELNGATDNPADDLPDPREEKNPGRPPTSQTTEMPIGE